MFETKQTEKINVDKLCRQSEEQEITVVLIKC